MTQQFYWANKDTQNFMKKGYLEDGETVQSRSRDIADAFAGYTDKDTAERFFDYLALGFYSLASPIWSNFGRERGLPISCNNSYFSDSMESIVTKTAEIAIMTKYGAGTSAYLGDLRPRGTPIKGGGTADGPVHFSVPIQTWIDTVSQGNTRRGNAAVYLDVEHADIMEFLNMREIGSPIQSLSLGVCISDAWMESMIAGDKEKRKIWARIIRKRFESGYPYIIFSDTMNRGAPEVYKDLGRKINGSNLCTEIALSSNEEESFVCDLSSMNLARFDAWESTDAVEVLVEFLDAVMSEYIRKTANIKYMEAARNFAINQRAIGIGTLGYHTYLQEHMFPFESFEAKLFNVKAHKLISERALKASQALAAKRGEPPMLEGYGRRNVTLMAIAPTTSSSFILGQVSPAIEPLLDNYFTKDLAKGAYTFKNPALKKVLASKGMDTDLMWKSILKAGGSVQHIEGLSQLEKDVFKTFGEISPMEIVQQASARQKFIDQAQSINLLIPADADPRKVSQLLIEGWRLGLKSFYYQRSSNPAQQLVRDITACVACEA